MGSHGLAELCNIQILGYSEKLLKLTEVFLPMASDNKIKDRMDAYNRAKMPHLKVDRMAAD